MLTYDMLLSLVSPICTSSASESSTLAPGTWVAVAFDSENYAQMHYAGVVKDKIRITVRQ